MMFDTIVQPWKDLYEQALKRETRALALASSSLEIAVSKSNQLEEAQNLLIETQKELLAAYHLIKNLQNSQPLATIVPMYDGKCGYCWAVKTNDETSGFIYDYEKAKEWAGVRGYRTE